MGAVSGIGSSVLVLGLMPFFESGFGILSTMKLLELSNPNHPLLRKILTETPGTYHHSVMVANLSEAACEAVGANGLLARVGAYYHDIGKTKRPQYFIENQMNIDNPHDKLSPQLSKNIIIAHATDGADMLRDHKMPKELVDIAEQHHGTSLLKFFTIRRKKKAIRRLKKSSAIPVRSPRQKKRQSSRWPTASKRPSAQCIIRTPKGLKSWCAGSYRISCRTGSLTNAI
ncbi:HDIG domain-containing metalloprotein [Bacillus licheniformis]